MQSNLRTLLVAAFLLFHHVATLSVPVRQRYSKIRTQDTTTTQPMPPSQDPWYTAPDGYEDAAPGAVLRFRVAPGDLTSQAGSNCSASYNILYRTTDSQGNATFAVTTVFVPVKPAASLLSYQIPYDSAWIDASPSFTLNHQFYSDISDGLGRGWFVTVPDYEGPLASFTAGGMSGHATLDAVRATLAEADMLGLPDDTLYALWGYSGGALASEWAAEMQVDYAPELNFVGMAMGGMTPNITNVLLHINEQISAGLAPPAILGLTSQWPDARDYILSKLKTTGQYTAAGFLAAENMTLSQAEQTYKFQDIYEYFEDGLSDITGPEVQPAINEDGLMGFHGTPQMPIFAYKAIRDEISPIADSDALINQFCAAGANIWYQRNRVGGHSAEYTNGIPAATAFLVAVLSGTTDPGFPATGCNITDVTVTVSWNPLKDRNEEMNLSSMSRP